MIAFQSQWLVWVVVPVAFGVGYVVRKRLAALRRKDAEAQAARLIEEAKGQAQRIAQEAELAAKALEFRIRNEFETSTQTRRQELADLEQRFSQRESGLDRKVDVLDKKEKQILQRDALLGGRETELDTRKQELDRMLSEERRMLERVSCMTVEDAKRTLVSRMEHEVRHEASAALHRLEEELKQEADARARKILGLAMQRCAAEHTVTSTVSVVTLPSDEMKGRIIGKEGRNIRAFETATGVDVVIDETPEAVVLSAFDTVRREVARIAMERLITDGRIHPSRIEEEVTRAREDVERIIKEEGERAVIDVDVNNLHPELVKMLGRLHYRLSHGQNVLDHLKETAWLMGVAAAELGLDEALARRIGLLHDIGKASGSEVEGPHALIGGQVVRKFGESEEVARGVEGHHAESGEQTIYAVLAQACDAISGVRPGARRETLENYIKRLEKLEQIADSFKEVDKAYAIRAGREVRIIVYPDRVLDNGMNLLARDIAKKIEGEMEFPGQIKVTIIRETRATEFAK